MKFNQNVMLHIRVCVYISRSRVELQCSEMFLCLWTLLIHYDLPCLLIFLLGYPHLLECALSDQETEEDERSSLTQTHPHTHTHTHTHTHKIDESSTSVLMLKSALSTYSEVLKALCMPLGLRPPRHNKSVLWCCGA